MIDAGQFDRFRVIAGGRLDCCASAEENEATAMSPATAETLPTLASDGLLIRSAAAIVRNDLGILALLINVPMSKKFQYFNSRKLIPR